MTIQYPNIITATMWYSFISEFLFISNQCFWNLYKDKDTSVLLQLPKVCFKK